MRDGQSRGRIRKSASTRQDIDKSWIQRRRCAEVEKCLPKLGKRGILRDGDSGAHVRSSHCSSSCREVMALDFKSSSCGFVTLSLHSRSGSRPANAVKRDLGEPVQIYT